MPSRDRIHCNGTSSFSRTCKLSESSPYLYRKKENVIEKGIQNVEFYNISKSHRSRSSWPFSSFILSFLYFCIHFYYFVFRFKFIVLLLLLWNTSVSYSTFYFILLIVSHFLLMLAIPIIISILAIYIIINYQLPITVIEITNSIISYFSCPAFLLLNSFLRIYNHKCTEI